MKNKVRYFALFREQAACAFELIEWPGGSAAELFQWVSARHPALTGDSAALVAVNDEMIDWAATINDNDEVLFFPPVAGG